MSKKYIYKKQQFQKRGIKKIKVIFDNGDYFYLRRFELSDISVKLYDRLIFNLEGYSAVAESGFLKFEVSRNRSSYENNCLCNQDEYIKNRKRYIENRCVNEGGIIAIQIDTTLEWNKNIFGDIIAEMDGKYLIIKFVPNAKYGSSSEEYHCVNLNDTEKSNIRSINLDFENCDHFTVYQDEIADVHLDFEDELDWSNYDLSRKIRSGYLKLKLDNNSYRNMYLISSNKTPTVKQLEKRLCGKKGKDAHDLCHLYVTYNYVPFNSCREECIEIDDIRPDEELARLNALEKAGEILYVDYISGYSKRLLDGSILVTFGKNAEELLEEFV